MTQFTPEQVQEILDIFFDQFAHRQYIGARYVPIFGRKDETSIEWDGGIGTYEPLTIVLYQGNSYTSRQFVPVGVSITNNEYWANTGNYNAQVEAYRQEVFALANMLPDSDFDSVNTVKKYIDDAVTALDGDITDEETERKIQDFIRAVTFENVTDMKASDDLISGMICHTNGFNEKGDGGAAWYEISDTGTANEKNVIACGELFANLITQKSMVNVDMLGAVGDGIEDDSSIIQFAVNNYRYIEFTNGKTYNIETAITISSANTTINGNNATIKAAIANAFVLGNNLAFCYISNFKIIDVTSQAISAPVGVRYSRIENIELRNCVGGIYFAGTPFVNRISNVNAFNMGANPIVNFYTGIDMQLENVSGMGYVQFTDNVNLFLKSCAIDNGSPSYTFTNTEAEMINCSCETYNYAINAKDSSIVTVNGGEYEGHISSGATFDGWFKASNYSKIIADTTLKFNDYGGTPESTFLFEISNGYVEFNGSLKDIPTGYKISARMQGAYSFKPKSTAMLRKEYTLEKITEKNFSEPIGAGGYRQNLVVLFEGAITNYDLCGAVRGEVQVNWYNNQWNIESNCDVVGYAAGGGNLNSLKPSFTIDANNNLVSTLTGFSSYNLDFKVFGFNF